MCGFRAQRETIPAEDFPWFAEMSKVVDFLIDPGIYSMEGFYLKPVHREELLKFLSCDFGTSGGAWTYTPQRWERLRWFLPCVQRSIDHLKSLYRQGGRAVEYYLGPVNNPGVEMNIICGGIISGNVNKSTEDVLCEAAELLYKPYDDTAARKLADVFKKAEDAYYNNTTIKGICEINLTDMHGEKPTPAIYLTENGASTSMNSEGRKNYCREMTGLMKEVDGLLQSFRERERLCRILVCIENVIKDVYYIENRTGECI